MPSSDALKSLETTANFPTGSGSVSSHWDKLLSNQQLEIRLVCEIWAKYMCHRNKPYSELVQHAKDTVPAGKGKGSIWCIGSGASDHASNRCSVCTAKGEDLP